MRPFFTKSKNNTNVLPIIKTLSPIPPYYYTSSKAKALVNIECKKVRVTFNDQNNKVQTRSIEYNMALVANKIMPIAIEVSKE